MKRNKIIAILLAGCLGMTVANAQEVLTLQQAIKYALQNKADAKKAALELENAEYQIDEVRAGGLPQVTGAAALTMNPMLQKSAIPGEIFGRPGETILASFGQKWQSNATLQVEQQLFNQSLFVGLKAAKTTREFYIINKNLTEEQLIEKVAIAYYDVFQTKLQLKTVDNNLNSTTKTRDVIKGLLDAGLGKKIDFDRTTVAVNNLQSNRQMIVNSLELKENALKFAIGMPIQETFKLQEESFDVNVPTDLLDPNDLSTRTEIKLLEKQGQLHRLNRDAMKAAYYPKLSFSGNIGYLGMGQSFPFFSNSAQWSPFSAVGLNLSIPIFNGGATKSKINQATINIKLADVELEDSKLGLTLENDNARIQIKNSLLTINTNRSNVSLAKDVLDDTDNNYKNGLATLTDLLDAEKAYTEAQNNLTTALLNYKVAEIQLIKAKGELNTLVNEK